MLAFVLIAALAVVAHANPITPVFSEQELIMPTPEGIGETEMIRATGIFCGGVGARERAKEIAARYKAAEHFDTAGYVPGCMYLDEVVIAPKGLDPYDLKHVVVPVLLGPLLLGCTKRCTALFVTGTAVSSGLLTEFYAIASQIAREELGE